jgi:tetratricopeptide (TPR) repeat protein
MSYPRGFDFVRLLGAFLWATTSVMWGEAGVLVTHVKDVQRRPIGGLQIGVDGDGGSAVTGDDGKARIPLAKQTKEKSWVFLQILKSPLGKDFVMVSPWDYRTLVPSFDNESGNFVDVVVVQRGDRAALESGAVLASVAAQINKANAPKTTNTQVMQEDLKANLAAVAKQYGLAPNDLDQAIRAWGAKATDPYDAGLAALYERDYSKASTMLADSLQKREKQLATDQKAVADAACFLGQSLWQEGKYRESATEYRRCLQLRPDDGAIHNNLALSLTYAGDYATAETLYQHALEDQQKAIAPDLPAVASIMNNFAFLLRLKGDYERAEILYRGALEMREKTLGPDNPAVGQSLNDLAGVLQDRGDYARAEPLYRRALAIQEKTLGPDSSDVAADLNNLALLLHERGDSAAAEPLYRRCSGDPRAGTRA